MLAMAAGLLPLARRQVGPGNLRVANDPSGIGRDNAAFQAFAPEAGDVLPPSGHLMRRGGAVTWPP